MTVSRITNLIWELKGKVNELQNSPRLLKRSLMTIELTSIRNYVKKVVCQISFSFIYFRKCDKREHYDNSGVMMVKILKTNISVNVQLTVWEKFASWCLKSFIVKSCSKSSPSKVPIHKIKFTKSSYNVAK